MGISQNRYYRFDGKGGFSKFEQFTPQTSRKKQGGKSFDWVHLHGDDPGTKPILEHLKLDPFVKEALLAQDTRPRLTLHGDGTILILRGVNLNEGADPEDMVSIRFWISKDIVVGIWLRRAFAVQDFCDALERGQVPNDPAEMITQIAMRLADRAEPVIVKLSDKMEALEENTSGQGYVNSQQGLKALRKTAVALRRYLVPQRDALTTLAIEEFSWKTDRDSSRIREVAERITRLGEELDELGDRAIIAHDHLLSIRAEKMNQTMLLLAGVTAVFLPLGLLTGVLGINVGGIPGTDSPYAFALVCLLVALIGLGLWAVMKRRGMLD